MKSPAFQFYPSDWLEKKVLRMSDAAQGVYMRLLCFMWNDSPDQCSIEKDDKIISKLLGISIQKWKKYRNEIMWNGDPIFQETETHYLSKRLSKEREKQRDKSEKATNAVKKRWDTNASKQTYGRNTDVSSGQYTSSSTTTSTTEVTPNIQHIEVSTAPENDTVLSVPPHHSEKHQALKAQATEILHHLNEIAGKKYQDSYPGVRHIIERLNEGRTPEEHRAIIAKKNKDPGFSRNWMRPETLFSKDNFDKYLMEDETQYGRQDTTGRNDHLAKRPEHERAKPRTTADF